MVALLEVEGDVKGIGHVEGVEVECDTYVFVAGEELLEDKEWSFEEFVTEKLYRWADTSKEYEGEFGLCWISRPALLDG
jgi:hypothetical protein